MSEYDRIPELGDLVTFESDVHGTTTGRIIYRDGSLIRVRPYNSSSTAIDFPLIQESGMFLESLGVNKVTIHEKRLLPHFSKQLSTVAGELLELFDADGNQLSEPGTVFEIIATDEFDAIKMEDGTVHDFGFVGPTAPIIVVRPRAAPAAAENDSAPISESDLEEEAAEENVNYPDIDFSLLPAALVEEVPSAEQTFSDSIQREDMFVSMLVDVPLKRQKDPKVMQNLYRVSDVLLALKNSVVTRDVAGAVITDAPSRSYIANTIQDALLKQPTGAPISSLLPVASVKKVLYADNASAANYNDVEFRSDVETLLDVAHVEQKFAEALKGTNAFASYLNGVLNSVAAYAPVHADDESVRVDQDVLRSQIPPESVDGFPSVPPAFDRDGNRIALTTDHLGSIKARNVRLLAPSYFRNPTTDKLIKVAPADTAATVAHVFLSKAMTRFRSPIRSSVLLWDIQSSEQSRSDKTIFYKSLMQQWEDQIVVMPEETVEIADQLQKRIRPALSYMNQGNVETLDSMGLRNLELTEEIFQPLVNAVDAGHARWGRAFQKLQASAVSALGTASAPAIPAVVGGDSALLKSLEDPVFTSVMKTFKEKETSLEQYDLAIANDLLKEANSTMGPLWYAVAGPVPIEVKTAAEINYKSEAGRIARNTTVQRDLAKEFTAAPSINPCKHMHQLEKIRSIRDDQTRMLLFEKFVKEYQAGQKGNWILCGMCGKDLVCKHELLLLNEFLNPGRGSALHKSLLLEYAGPVFEGAYICKNCGQKIQDIEYDTHLEFDDEGRPLIGRNIVVEEDKDETDLAMVLEEEVKEKIPFKGADLALYYNFRTVFERCGMAVDMAAYQRVVAAAQDFLKTNVPPQSAYEARQKQLAAAKKPIGIPYGAFYANFQIGVMGALSILELQTSSVQVPIPATGCPFSRDGFPLDGPVMSTAGSGAFNYILCVMMSINRNDAPWNLTPWSGMTGKARQTEIEKVIKGCLYSLLCLPMAEGAAVPPPLTTVTDNYRTLLADAAAHKKLLATGTSGVALASNSDILPSSFRPLPRIAVPAVFAERPITNLERFQRDVQTADISKIAPVVYGREYQLTQQHVAKLHKAAEESGIVVPTSARSDSVCCFSRLGVVALNGLSALSEDDPMTAEIHAHTDAAALLKRRDPALSASGTHIFVPWSAPLENAVAPSADTASYYKLFLKHCFRGRNYGAVHEYSHDYACRQCRFKYPEELVFLTSSEISETDGKKRERLMNEIEKQRKEIALAALASDPLGVDINEATFHALELEIRQKKIIVTPEPIVQARFMDLLEGLGSTLDQLLPDAKADWASLMKAITEIKVGALTGVGRIGKLGDFSRRYDMRLAQLKQRITDIMGPRATKVIDQAMLTIASVTEDPIASVSVRNLTEIFVVRISQIAHQFLNIAPRSKKWFPKISRNHEELLKKIWLKSSTVTQNANTALKNLDEEVQEIVKSVCDKFAQWFGQWLAVWRINIRPDADLTTQEYTFVLRWSVFSGLLALLTPSSPLYSGSIVLQQEVSKFLSSWMLESLSAADGDVQTYQLNPSQIMEAINARAELEKNSFIQKFDKLDRDLRKVELMKKKLKIGDWAVGNVKNLFTYDADFFEFEREQRAAMGLPEFSADITGAGAAEEDRYGMYNFGEQEVGMEDASNHRAAQDEDV